MESLDRLLRPASIAVIGGGAWCANVLRECQRIGFKGALWPVHPTRDEIGGLRVFRQIEDLPAAPDATFIGINRALTVEAVATLSAMGAGGAVCFASGFREAVAELGDGADLQSALIDAAGDMRILGPNCYGFINALDGALLWPDQHGAVRVDRGVALVTQSSNIAINLTMQTRGLPLAYVVTAGNQAQTGLAEIGEGLIEDPRVSALGLHIEGIGDLARFEAMAETAHRLGKAVVALKIGRSDQAQAATISHTASLAGSDAGARVLLARLGIGQVGSLAVLLETLKLLHVAGPLRSNRIASLSCSGGEASLMADTAHGSGLVFPPLVPTQREGLRAALGPRVALANPLDYHTYIWGDQAATTACFTAMMRADLAMGCAILDFPRPDRCDASDWQKVVAAIEDTGRATGVPMAMVASLPETMPEATAIDAVARGIVPFAGLSEAVEAMAVAAFLGQDRAAVAPLLIPCGIGPTRTLSEAEAKAALSRHGLRVPRAIRAGSPAEAARAAGEIGFPVVLKGEGVAHKTEAGAVVLGLGTEAAVAAAAEAMPAAGFLVEEMVAGTVAELLVGVVRDPAHGFVLTLGAGGTLTEILGDAVSLLVPASPDAVRAALGRLRIAALLAGYRGKPTADMDAIVAAVMAIQAFVRETADGLAEVEVNPLLCGPGFAIAADALIRLGDDE